MWNYEKRLEYPINIKRTDAAMAKAIISQFGGPDGETGAAMRYLSQRLDRKSTRLNSSHTLASRMPSSA